MKILIVEDDELLRQGLQRALGGEHYSSDAAASLAEAQQLLQLADYELLILDLGVITSYSIHYTKLYDRQRRCAVFHCQLSRVRPSLRPGSGSVAGVITSYSIHYTKLYESKVAIFAVLLRFFMMVPATNQDQVHNVLSLLAMLSILFGNLLALKQTNIKRLLGYSSIAHFGYP